MGFSPKPLQHSHAIPLSDALGDVGRGFHLELVKLHDSFDAFHTIRSLLPTHTLPPPRTHTRSADVPEMSSSSGTQAMLIDATQQPNICAYLEHQRHGVGASLASGLEIRD